MGQYYTRKSSIAPIHTVIPDLENKLKKDASPIPLMFQSRNSLASLDSLPKDSLSLN
jgi:hypothetical protein